MPISYGLRMICYIDFHATISRMDEGLLALFEYIKQDFLSLSLEDFTIKANKDGSALDISSAITSTPLAYEWSQILECKGNCYTRKLSSQIERGSLYKAKVYS